MFFLINLQLGKRLYGVLCMYDVMPLGVYNIYACSVTKYFFFLIGNKTQNNWRKKYMRKYHQTGSKLFSISPLFYYKSWRSDRFLFENVFFGKKVSNFSNYLFVVCLVEIICHLLLRHWIFVNWNDWFLWNTLKGIAFNYKWFLFHQ